MDSDKEARKGEKYFVGGGPSSGQEVGVPEEEDSVDELIEELFESARVEASDGRPIAPQAFFGYGRRLGHTAATSPFIAPTMHEERTVNLRVYRDGYTIDEGPLLAKNSPDSAEFFESLQKGVVPARLAAMYPLTKISLRLIDCMHIKYKDDTHFPGYGKRLDGTVVGAHARAEPKNPAGDEVPPVPARVFELHDDDEQVKIAIVNLFGERKEFLVNSNRHTVEDVYGLAAEHAHIHLGKFTLVVRDVPPRQLNDESQTVNEAKLRNCTIMVRIR